MKRCSSISIVVTRLLNGVSIFSENSDFIPVWAPTTLLSTGYRYFSPWTKDQLPPCRTKAKNARMALGKLLRTYSILYFLSLF